MCYATDERDNLIIKYLPLVKRIAGRIETKSSQYDQNDLISVGVIGLMDSLDKYDYKKGVPFEVYASMRIKGTIIDELRKSGKVSRGNMAKVNKFYKVKENLENELMRMPEDAEICKELGIDKKELNELYDVLHYLSHISLDSVILSNDGNDVLLIDMIKDKETVSTEEKYEKDELNKVLKDAINMLGEREKVILNLYYVEELTLTEIAYILDISIPRVSQIHGKILIKLRRLIKSMMGEL